MSKVFSGLIWKFLERFGTVGIQFIIQIILARLLSPDDYGAIALITVFITVSNVFVQNGFNTALIQRQDVTEEDYSSVFWISMLVALICYIILFILSPFIADFYSMSVLNNVLKVLGLTLFFGAYNSIQIAKISKEFKFKKLFYSSLIGMCISGITGIILAMNRFGVWTLVFQQLLNQIIISFVLYFQVDWKLKIVVNIKRVKLLFGFGSKLLVSSLIDVIYNNIYNLVIGKVYDSTTLGYYNRADQFPNLIVNNVNGSIQSVILPALAEHQDNKPRVKEMMRKAMTLSSYLVFPLMIGMAACAEPMIELLLTDKWLPCVPYLRLLCFSYMLWPIHTANLQAINALGHSEIFLKLEIIKKVIGIIALVISTPFGVIAMVSMKVITSIISTFINALPNKSLLNYSYKSQIFDLLPTFIISTIMGILVFVTDNLLKVISLGILSRLILDVIIGIIIYIILSLITKNKNFKYFLDMLKKIFTKKGDV
ncbi:MAG: lipopolysaccharide biosynthesis protein [Erysipelotrichaceae bacterium]|nr:lipopolysaccharide biosynthesis protein [Erysipelotrichaceae bacterium]